MTFKVTILGSSSAKPSVRKHHSAQVVNLYEQYYLVDCGEGTQLRLMECGINPLKINTVFISHIHGDHSYGLLPMISTLGLMGRKTPLDVYAPKPFGEIMECHFKYFDLKLPFEVIWHEVDTRTNSLIYENKVMEVWTIPLRHRVPCAGYLFKEKTPPKNICKEAVDKYNLGIAQIVSVKNGENLVLDSGEMVKNEDLTYTPFVPRSYAYISDTHYSGRAVTLSEGVNLMYHEATFADRDKTLAKETGHSTTLQAARAALTAGADKLIIGHFSSRYKVEEELLEEARTLFPETYIAEEGVTFTIPIKKTK